MIRKILSRLMAFALCFIMIATVIPPVNANAAVVKPVVTIEKNEYGDITVKWTKSGTLDEISYYRVYRAKDNSGTVGTYKNISGEIYAENDLFYDDYDAVPNNKYYYKVNAYNTKGESVAQSDVKSAIRGLYEPMVERIAHDAATGSPIVSWGESYKADRYYVYRSKSAKGTYSKIGSTTKEQYTDKNAAAGTTYYYKVKAISDKYSSANSNYSNYKYGKKVAADTKLATAIDKAVNSNGNLVEIYTLAETMDIVSGLSLDRLSGFDGTDFSGTNVKLYINSKTIQNAGGTLYSTGQGLGDAYYSQVLYLVKKNGITYNPINVKAFGINVVNVREGSSQTEINNHIKAVVGRYYPSSNWTITSKKYTTSIGYADMAEMFNKAVKNAGYGKYTANKYFITIKNKKTGKKTWTFATVVPTLNRLSKPVVTISNLSGTPDMKVSWKKVSGADKYEVWKKVGTNGTYKKVKTTTSISYRDTTTVKGKRYYYKVKAVKSANSTQNSLFSSVKYKTCV